MTDVGDGWGKASKLGKPVRHKAKQEKQKSIRQEGRARLSLPLVQERGILQLG